MEQTLVIIKPDAVLRKRAGLYAIQLVLSVEGSHLEAFGRIVVSEALAKQHYAEHKDQPYFEKIVRTLTSPVGVIVILLRGPEVVKKVRAMLGASFVEQAVVNAPCISA
jgi:nucleoside-diphosphate kinase